MRKQSLLAIVIACASHAPCQTPWVLPGNNSTNPSSDYLGTDDPNRLTIRTDDLFRLQVNESEDNNIGSFSLMPTDGFVAISPNSSFWSNGDRTPFTRLHLAEGTGDNAQSHGYRPWQRNGVTFTGNGDQAYIGHKYTFEDPQDHTSGEVEDLTDAVFQWSDNPGQERKDRMRFIFTSAYDEGEDDGAESLEGLEAMRFFPVDFQNVNVGLGDFFAANLANSSIVEPEERLDLVDGNLRIRELPGHSPEAFDKVMIVDDDGVVHWRPSSDFTSCDWTIENAGTSGPAIEHDVVTAVGSSDLG